MYFPDTSSKPGPSQPKGSKNASPRTLGSGCGRQERPPVPPELRQPGITDMKKFCKAAGIRFDYKKLVEGCTKTTERVAKMLDLLIAAGLEGKPTLEKCKALKQAKLDEREQEILASKEARAKHNDEDEAESESSARRMTRGATGFKPRQRIEIFSDEEDGTPAASVECDSQTDMSSKPGPSQPKGSKNASPRTLGSGSGRQERPPVPPELRQPGVTDMKKFCKAAGIRFDYKELVEGCTKNTERVAKMLDLLIAAGLEGKPTLEKCKALKQAKLDEREQEILASKEARAKHNDEDEAESESSARRMTRGATGFKPRQRIEIFSDEEDGTPAASVECDSQTDMSSKPGPSQPKGSKNASPRALGSGSGRQERPPVPPELRQPGITDMKKFCKAAGIRFNYKKLVEGCTKNKERVAKMLDLLIAAGLEGKPTLEKCKALKQAKLDERE